MEACSFLLDRTGRGNQHARMRPWLWIIVIGVSVAASASVPGATVVCLGDSITAGLGLSEEQAYPAVVQELAHHEGLDWTVVNAGVSGDTTAGGLRRVDWLLKSKPDLILIALGANDGLRGVPVATSKANLLALLDRLSQAQVKAALAGMLLPRNYGEDYRTAFAKIYPDIAQQRSLPFLPFLLEGVGGLPSMNQADGIHPTVDGQRLIATHVFAFIKSVLIPGGTP